MTRTENALRIMDFLYTGDMARKHIIHTAARQKIIRTSNFNRWPNLKTTIELTVSWPDSIYCARSGTAKFRLNPSSATGGRSGFKHRLFVCCPDCNKWVPTGRFTQHNGSGPCVTGR